MSPQTCSKCPISLFLSDLGPHIYACEGRGGAGDTLLWDYRQGTYWCELTCLLIISAKPSLATNPVTRLWKTGAESSHVKAAAASFSSSAGCPEPQGEEVVDSETWGSHLPSHFLFSFFSIFCFLTRLATTTLQPPALNRSAELHAYTHTHTRIQPVHNHVWSWALHSEADRSLSPTPNFHG